MNELKQFLRFWKKRNYIKMYRYVQKTWKHNHTLGELKAMFDLPLLDYEIAEAQENIALSDVTCSLHIEGLGWRVSKIRLIKETAPYKAAANGTWGVNPISILKQIKADEYKG
jgi:hypothetical protein